jgi:hypothetical protein
MKGHSLLHLNVSIFFDRRNFRCNDRPDRMRSISDLIADPRRALWPNIIERNISFFFGICGHTAMPISQPFHVFDSSRRQKLDVRPSLVHLVEHFRPRSEEVVGGLRCSFLNSDIIDESVCGLSQSCRSMLKTKQKPQSVTKLRQPRCFSVVDHSRYRCPESEGCCSKCDQSSKGRLEVFEQFVHRRSFKASNIVHCSLTRCKGPCDAGGSVSVEQLSSSQRPEDS